MTKLTMIDRIATNLHHLTEKNGGTTRGAADMREDARVILLAMKDASEAMKASGGQQVGNDGHFIGEDIAGWTWERMVEAALAEESR
jgi:hypothetical protein